MRNTALSALAVIAVLVAACNKPASAGDGSSTRSTVSAATATADAAVVNIAVGEDGFAPAMVHAQKGKKLTLRFTRTTDATCAKQVVFPELGIKKDLPLNQPVDIVVPAGEARTLGFQCGMGMFKGSVMVQ